MRTIKTRIFLFLGLLGVLPLLPGGGARAQSDTVKTEIELSTKEIDAKENAIGSLVADAMRSAASADAAFIAASAFTDIPPLPKGNVSIANILKALEFKSDTVVVVRLTGAQITRALEHGLYLYPKPNSGFLQFSGLTVTVNPDAAKEKRVVSTKVDGSALDANRVYRVAMPAPLANGALAYFKIWKKSDIEKDTGKTLEAVVADYLRTQKTITKGDERLVIKGK